MKQQRKVSYIFYSCFHNLQLFINCIIFYFLFLECANTNYNELRPFKCLDLTYISVLLEQGFGLPVETSVSVSNDYINWQIIVFTIYC